MSTTVLQRPAVAPAAPAANSRSLAQRLWASLEAMGQRRAAAEMRRLAFLYQGTNPALSRRLREAAAQSQSPRA